MGENRTPKVTKTTSPTHSTKPHSTKHVTKTPKWKPFPTYYSVESSASAEGNNDSILIFVLGITVGIILISILGFCFFYFCVYKREENKRRSFSERRASNGRGLLNFGLPPMRASSPKHRYGNPELAPSYIGPENFVHRGHLIIDKYEEPQSRHALEDHTPSTAIDRNLKVTWQDKHEVFDFGENVEEVISNREHTLKKMKEKTKSREKEIVKTASTQETKSLEQSIKPKIPTGGAEDAKKLSVNTENAKKPSVNTENAKKPSINTENPKKPSVNTEDAKKLSGSAEDPKKDSGSNEDPKKDSGSNEDPKKDSGSNEDPKKASGSNEDDKKSSGSLEEDKTATSVTEDTKDSAR